MSKSVTVRVTGIPKIEARDAETLVKKIIQLEEHTEVPAQCKVHVVPTCGAEDSLTALVDFKDGLPRFLDHLAKNPLDEWGVEVDTEEFQGDVSFDCHFHGLTQLYPVKDVENVAADIIAVTGLDGHAFGSWKGRGNLGRMWLRDFLRKDFPNCRTMIYGYNSKLQVNATHTILDFGRQFLHALDLVRQSETVSESFNAS
jgi:hypothetical protein